MPKAKALKAKAPKLQQSEDHPNTSEIRVVTRWKSDKECQALLKSMAPSNPGDNSHQQLLDQLDITSVPKPFRNPNWKPSQRRNKNIKQMITENARREASMMATQNNSGASTPLPSMAGTDGTGTPLIKGAHGNPNISQATQSLSTLVLEKSLAQAQSSGPQATYTNIESAPSLNPAHQRKYCDITGLPAPYTDPKTRLRYHNKEVFAVVRSLGQGVAEQYLEARGAHVILK
ncbi:MAG: hypothetical protein M1834_001231 [Cirrosporium novae-zelandiae]|nr:MAG: hypothetical protein M1834_001231 [Cirrosporium novae-zelandiae]